MRIDSITVFQSPTNNPIGIIKFFHEVSSIGYGCLIAATEVVIKHDKCRVGVVCIDRICSSRPTSHTHFSEVVISKIVEEIQMFYPSVKTIANVNAKLVVVFDDIQCAILLFVAKPLLVKLLANTVFQRLFAFGSSEPNGCEDCTS